MAGTTMVPVAHKFTDRGTNSPSSERRSPVLFDVRVSSTAEAEQFQASGVEDLLQRDIKEGISQEDANLLAKHSWRKGTTSAYNSNWRQWSSWWTGKQINPFQAQVVEIVNYLTEKYEKGGYLPYIKLS